MSTHPWKASPYRPKLASGQWNKALNTITTSKSREGVDDEPDKSQTGSNPTFDAFAAVKTLPSDPNVGIVSNTSGIL